MEYPESNQVVITINGKVHVVKHDIPVDTSLNTYIREHLSLSGTKFMCTEGGCGCCVVNIRTIHPVTKMEDYYAANSCMVPVLSCHGSCITTIEGLGDRLKGYSPIQSNLARYSGTQCGYCSPGFVMNMYSLLKTNPNLTAADIENNFGGNICRCTGYRPIIDAFRALTKDGVENKMCSDIEDILKICPNNGTPCKEKCKKCPKRNAGSNNAEDSDSDSGSDYASSFLEVALAPRELRIEFGPNSIWYKVNSIPEIFQVFDLIGNATYMLIAGNTAKGVYPLKNKPSVYIDVKDVPELRAYSVYNDHVQLGGNMPLKEVTVLFDALAKEKPLLFGYLEVLKDHIELVASTPIRNVATLAGNLMIKHNHRQFQSDIFLLMVTSGASITICDMYGVSTTMTMLQFLETDMNKKVICSLLLPPISSMHYKMATFKIMPRSQSNRAWVNAGFLFRLNAGGLVEERPKIVFGGISDRFVYAYQTETYLTLKPLLNMITLTNALKILASEVNPNVNPPDPSPKYRKLLALALFYRFVLSIRPRDMKPFYRSGSHNLIRPLSTSKQDYPTFQDEWPVSQPVPKLEALIQCSGEAQYVNDIPLLPDELHAEFVISDTGPADILSIDPTLALKQPGVVAFFKASDIPGMNSFTPLNLFFRFREELFASKKVNYAGQPVGMIVAKTREIAIENAKLVKVQYANVKKPVLTVDDVLASGDQKRIVPTMSFEPTKSNPGAKITVSGELRIGFQFHFTMELHSTLCVPVDEDLNVYVSTQYQDMVHKAISQVLNMKQSSINLETRRCGGSYGSRISRSTMIAAACSLAAKKLNHPVRMVPDLVTTMRALGKRGASLLKYKAGVDENGKILNMDLEVYTNKGYNVNDRIDFFINSGIKSCYDFSTWRFKGFDVLTDLPSSTWMRAPGTLESVTSIENIMEHIAHVLKKDAWEVRLQNILPDNPIIKLYETIKVSSDYDQRAKDAVKFNKENRWKKRGMAIVPMTFSIGFLFNQYATVSIYEGDGTVAICHGGVEVGQGINTKAAQVCAYTLGVPLDYVKIKPNNVLVSPNNGSTGGSITSDAVASAVIRSCEILNQRLAPSRQKLKNPTWLEVVRQAFADGVDLKASHMWLPTDPIPKDYVVYGMSVLETEVDILTGQQQILRADLLEDAGKTLSPQVDLGQIEGGFVQGLGYFLQEELIFHPNNGALLTDRTWTYIPPLIKDIPIDFRVTIEKNAENPLGVLRSKATGEPPTCMSCSVYFALRNALRSARVDAGLGDDWFKFDPPCTIENILLTSGTSPKQFAL